MKINRWLSVFNVVAVVLTLIVNSLANVLPINGRNTGEISALYPSLFTPAGITFSIWSVIYLLLIGFSIYQLYAYFVKPAFRELSIWFILSCLLNAGWILAWHYLLPVLSLIIMILLLVALINIFLLLNHQPVTLTIEKAFVRLPFTIYFAWICVATIANASAVLVTLPDPTLLLGEVPWTIIMMVIATILALFITVKYKAPAFSAVIIWALFGIFLRWQKTEYSILATVAVLLLILLSSVYIYSSRKFLREQ